MTVNDCAKNLLADKICENCSWKITACFSSSKETWCHRMIKKPQEETCDHFLEVPAIMRSLKEYVLQKHI